MLRVNIRAVASTCGKLVVIAGAVGAGIVGHSNGLSVKVA